MTFPDDEALIRAALVAAREAGSEDVPIGAVIYAADGTELARAANARERLGDPTAHAEVLALRAAAAKHGDGWRLEPRYWSSSSPRKDKWPTRRDQGSGSRAGRAVFRGS
ncbi:cytidine/deoxycytidylate deaminase family protein [Mycobacteroides abscessus subsp. abscessus]|nr:cytidine/deoxycytidylate deaminase family protein [Mycobacteroides abscessus subsp. abscessus]